MHQTGDQEVTGLSHVWQHSFVQTDHEIFSMLIFSLLVIQEGQLSVCDKRMCTNTARLVKFTV